VTDRLVVDLGADGAVRVATVPEGGDVPIFADAAALRWPLDEDALEDLRWYLEDYLTAPYGVYEDRGARIAGDLDGWGRQVFGAVFGSGPARDAYMRIRARGDVEIVFRSAVPGLLGLPWELMADPRRDTPLAMDVAGVSRALPAAPDAPETVPVPGGRLRVLMVISRPSGTADVGYQMVARPLLTRLDAVRGQVDLVVLRPPTLAALGEELNRAAGAGTPYQVVHFDGHGAFQGLKTSDLGEGVLVFEHPSGGPQAVPAKQIARLLADSRVPVVVLNACQSGAVGKQLEAAVATSLLAAGVASVVAMAYSVYAVAAAEFMAAFYERLFAGGTVAAAVTAGRRQLFRVPGRPSAKGDLPLADWVVPVHYARREVSFPQARVERSADLPSLADALTELGAETSEGVAGDLNAVDGVFVGRDALFYDLEVATRLQKVVVLVGPGGTGKTELAKAFGRWWRDTGGVEQPEWVCWHSFEPGAASFGLDGVISEVGLALYGADFGRWDAAQQRAQVRAALAAHRVLLIWDNFESVREMPDPGRATPPLDEAGCAQIREFLAGLAGGKSAVLITSRTHEEWLGDVRRIEVGGLTASEAVAYADLLLASCPGASESRGRRAFAELLDWLDGHPLSMRLTLPRLDTATPQALLETLRDTVPPESDDAVTLDRTRSLAASIGYSYAHLNEQTRRLLPAVSFFHGVADAHVLSLFSEEAEAPRRFAGAAAQDWVAALRDAARVGLMTRVDVGRYQVHPALPGYLSAVWRAEEDQGGQTYDQVRDAATQALLTAHAALGHWLSQRIASGEAGTAYAILGLERRTLGSFLSYAISRRHWAHAQGIAQPLVEYWRANGMDTEAAAWAERVLSATETLAGDPSRLDVPMVRLRIYFAGVQASYALKRGQVAEAERRYLEIVDTLNAADSWPEGRVSLGNVYHELGRVAQARGRLGDAEAWYRKALEIAQEADNQPGMAKSCYQLGLLAQIRGDLAGAEQWLRGALAIEQETGDTSGAAITYSELGVVAAESGRLREAEQWLRAALAIDERSGDRFGMAATLHQLATVAMLDGRLAGAEEWYRQSLAIEQEVGDHAGMAGTYHQLGLVAQLRGELADARQWHRASLALRQQAGDRRDMASTYLALGLVAEEAGDLPEALEWMTRCVAMFDDFLDPQAQSAPGHLARLTEMLGIGALAEAWKQVTGNDLPQAVREYVVGASGY
jgi:tetratricopeptide (TPR) repeat protein